MMENRSFDNLFGRFPGVNGTTVGVKSGEEVPLIQCPDWLPGRPPARSRRGAQLPERRQARRVRGRRVRRPVVVLAVPGAPAPQLLALGAGVRAVGQLLRVGARPVVPEPLLLHRRSVGRRDRQPGEHRSRVRGEGRREAVQELGLRRARRRRLRVGEGRQGQPDEARLLLQLQDGRPAAHRDRRRLALLLRRPRAGRATSGTRTTGSTTSSTPICGTSTRRTRSID